MAQQIAAQVEREQGAARVLTNLGSYQDSKHLHVHVSSGDELGTGERGNPVVRHGTGR